MYRESLKLIVRKLSRSRLYSFINIAGLAIALTAALLIYSHVVKEFKTNRFHENREHIFRVTTSGIFSDQWSYSSCAPMGPYALSEIPEVQNYTRIARTKYLIQTDDSTDLIEPERTIQADARFFDIFTFPLIAGGIPKPDASHWCVITESQAEKLFGNTKPIGETIRVKHDTQITAKPHEYQVVAVMKDIPAWSTIQADIVFNYGAVEDFYWNNWGIDIFFQLQPQANVRKVEKTIPELYVQNYKYGASQKLQVKLQPLNDLYFHSEHIASNEWWGYIPQGSPQLTLILCIVTFIILLLVTCNFLMIKIARLSKEFAGLAVQKCYGASNRTLQMQFLLETGVQVIIALVIAIIATYILHPRFIEIISPKQLYPLHLSIADIAFFAILVLLLIVGIGGSLCFYITRYLNRNSVKEVIQKKAGYFDLKKILAVTQMCIFCTLLFCSAILIRQMDFIRTKDLGMNSHNVIAFTVWANNFETLKAEFGNDPSIELVSIGSSIPENESWTTEYAFPEQPDEKFKSSILMGDADFIRIHQIELTEGENIHEETYLRQQKEVNEYYHRQNEAQKAGIPFEEKEPSYEVEALVNQQFVKEHRLTHPVGTLIKVNDLNYRIIGVTGNFHYLPLYNNIEPLIICYNGGFNDQRIKVRYREGCREQALSHLKKVHETLPVRENEFGFEEYQYSDFYDKDITFIKMINIFTILSVFIGGMGIFAFSVFLAENKKKEIALRKINGATEWQVMSLLNRSFIYRTVISCAIGIPIAYFLMQKWLEGYAYKTPLSGWIFIAVVMACVALVAFIISWQTWNAATQNPAESIKSE